MAPRQQQNAVSSSTADEDDKNDVERGIPHRTTEEDSSKADESQSLVEEGKPQQSNAIKDHANTRTNPSQAQPFPRLVERNLPFYQSKNKVSVIHNKGVHIMPLLRHDWFHAFMRMPD